MKIFSENFRVDSVATDAGGQNGMPAVIIEDSN